VCVRSERDGERKGARGRERGKEREIEGERERDIEKGKGREEGAGPQGGVSDTSLTMTWGVQGYFAHMKHPSPSDDHRSRHRATVGS
jgi:hypothetical protein